MELAKELGSALADCDEAIRLDPTSKTPHAIRAASLANKGELGAALGEWITHPFPVKLTFGSK